MKSRKISSMCAGLCMIVVSGCSPSSHDDHRHETTGGNTPVQGGTGGAGGITGAGLSSGGDTVIGAGGLNIGDLAPRGSGGSTADASCAGVIHEAEAVTVEKIVTAELKCTSEAPQPISIYLMLDNSGSMAEGDKWTDAVAAISAFVRSDPSEKAKPWTCIDKDGHSVTPPQDLPVPPTGTISVALQYFHPEQADGAVDECDGSGHRTPAVPMGPIPSNAGAITGSLDATGPNGNTPTVGALTGGTGFCVDFQKANPAQKCVIVLITDGQPNGCGLSSSSCGNADCVDPDAASTLTPIAGDAFATNDGVNTFTVGMNGVSADGFKLLNQIAIAGGSDCTPGIQGNEACNVATGGSQAFLDALNTIRKSVQVATTSSQTITTTTTETSTVQCEWAIPRPTNGLKFDQGLVNVSLSTAGTTNRLANVSNGFGCAAAGGGWYYDDVNAPAKILTCPATCAAIQAASDAKVEVIVGCATESSVAR